MCCNLKPVGVYFRIGRKDVNIILQKTIIIWYEK